MLRNGKVTDGISSEDLMEKFVAFPLLLKLDEFKSSETCRKESLLVIIVIAYNNILACNSCDCKRSS